MLYANNYVDAIQIKENGWTIISDVPAIIFAKVGAAVLLNRKRLVREPFLLDNNMMEYSISQPVWDLSFALSLFETLNLPSYIQIGALPSYNTSDIENIEIYLPEHQREKSAIGQLFSTIDSLIAAEKRKLQLIEMKKRLLLQRILSRKMRFGGFCDSWIQLKLDDAICVCSGKDYKHLSKGNIPVYGTGGYMTRVSKALSNRDAIGIGRKGTIDKPYVLHAPFWTVDTLFYALPRNGYDLNFLFAVFQNINWKSKNESTGLPSLSKKNIENTSIITPSIDEQCRIGELFSLFDSILDETNQKIRLLEKKKKALLRDMFV